MSKGFGIHGSTTDHGGIVISTQSRSSQMGNLFLRAGDGFACPKCKTWSTLIKSNDHVIFDGKAVAYVGDKFTCGATLMPKQVHVIGASSGANSVSSLSTKTTSITSNLVEDTLEEIHKIQFKIIDEDSEELLSNMLYELYSKESGELLVQGYTDENGMTAIYESEYRPEAIELITIDLSKTLEPL
ncbi:MAG: PAAR domain-containing protein [Candidatus Acinetobacter avistercoris]|uniref:PAAR domain-containing protein n=1 Tax=Acinetobacter sp. KS-LM10 TaxID=3120518 RepID=UPI001F9EFDE9|nr:PAAR domain-containing protein [Candidatus Acinetobacter avistercoris]